MRHSPGTGLRREVRIHGKPLRTRPEREITRDARRREGDGSTLLLLAAWAAGMAFLACCAVLLGAGV